MQDVDNGPGMRARVDGNSLCFLLPFAVISNMSYKQSLFWKLNEIIQVGSTSREFGGHNSMLTTDEKAEQTEKSRTLLGSAGEGSIQGKSLPLTLEKQTGKSRESH